MTADRIKEFRNSGLRKQSGVEVKCGGQDIFKGGWIKSVTDWISRVRRRRSGIRSGKQPEYHQGITGSKKVG